MRREEHRAGDDQRVLVLLAELLPEATFAKMPSYGSRSFSLRMRCSAGRQRPGAALRTGVGCARVRPVGSPSARCLAAGAGRRPRRRGRLGRASPCSGAMSASGSDVGFDDAQRRLRAQLAAQQAHRFEVRVHILGAAADEPGDEHALERRHVHLRLDRRLDRDLVEVVQPERRTAATSAERQASDSLAAFRAVIDFFEQIVVLPDHARCSDRARAPSRTPSAPCRTALVLVGDREVVPGGGVGRIDLDRLLPAVDGFAPEPFCATLIAELDLRLRVAARVGVQRQDGQRDAGTLRGTVWKTWPVAPLYRVAIAPRKRLDTDPAAIRSNLCTACR